MTRRRNRQLDLHAHRANRAADIVPTVYDHLDEQRANVTDLAAPAGNGRTSGTHSDPTWRTLAELDRIDNRKGRIADAIAALNVAMNVLDDACRDALGHRVSAEAGENARCIGDGTAEGATCWGIADKRTHPGSGQTIEDGRCIKCGPRYDARRTEAERARRNRRAGVGS